MVWTKLRSARAVAARARRRLARAAAPPDGSSVRVFTPRRPAADFIIRISTCRGDRIQISLTRFGRRFLTADGPRSARQISRGIEMLLLHSA